MKTIQAMLAFNRGVVASKALARIDLEKLRLAAEIQENWMPDVLGSMSLRPGFEYKCATYLNRKTRGIPFVFASDDTAIIEMTDSIMRVLIDGIPISIPAVSSSITNGTFNSNLSGWTNADGGGCVSAWKTGGYMSLKGTGFAFARERQQVTVSGGDSNIEHVLKMRIYRGVITLKVGTTSGGNEYFEYSLTEGDHSLSFVPTGSFWIEISASTQYESLVDYITIDTGGVFSISSPYEEAYLDYIRFDQSADVVFLACKDHSPYKIERRSTRSWSIVKYAPNDGPFRDINISAVRMTPSATTGDITLTASSSFFKSSHVGGLIKITSSGQLVTGSLSGIGQFTNYIRVTGTGSSQRQFTITRSGTWVGTLRVQRSVAEPGSWVDVLSYTTNGSVAYNDGLDNQIIYYRIGFDTGDYTSGTATVSLEYSSGSIDGIVRISGYTSNTSASAIVVKELGGTSSTADWYEGEWSDYRGWPSAVCLYEGRLWMAGKTKIWGSVSDAYSSIDIDVEGDSGAISRSIGSGAVDNINFLIPLQRLIIGTLGSEIVAKSSSLDEPLTPTAFSLKDSSTYGSKGISPIKLDSSGLFVHRGGTKLLEISLANGYDYSTKDLNLLNPDICLEGITRLGVQRMPDTRAHCILNDGTVALLVYDAGESVLGRTGCTIRNTLSQHWHRRSTLMAMGEGAGETAVTCCTSPYCRMK